MQNPSTSRTVQSDKIVVPDRCFIFSSMSRKIRARSLTPIDIHRDFDPAFVVAAANVALNKIARNGQFSAIVGAIPFFNQSKPALFVSGSIDGNIKSSTVSPSVSQVSTRRVTSVPDDGKYISFVNDGLRLIATGVLEKIVLARTLEIDASEPIDLDRLLATLLHHNTHGFTFLVPSTIDSENTVFIGASPELLLRKSGHCIETNPLAGSIRRGDTPVEDQKKAEALLASSKDRREHAIVVAAVAQALRPYCRCIDVPETPSLIKTSTVWHLSTHIKGELADPNISSIELALALHPTPAVCGHPTDAAFSAISKIEGDNRGLYAGLVGWNDVHGDGEWAVALRCAEISGSHVRLFAGAGIVAGSDPQAELEETSAKLRTMLEALQIVYPLNFSDRIFSSANQERRVS